MSDTADQADQPPRPNHSTDLSGRSLGDFRLLRRLDRGAMAEVYLAEQTTLRRRVAVKVLKAELAGDQTYLRRFEREAQAAASLVHGNIVQIYEVGQHEGIHCIAQEYVQGENLAQWVRRHEAALRERDDARPERRQTRRRLRRRRRGTPAGGDRRRRQLLFRRGQLG